VTTVRNIRFLKADSTFQATLDYYAAPVLNALGRQLASDGYVALGQQEYKARLLLTNDGWQVSSDGIQSSASN
jgi:hypothetical protein